MATKYFETRGPVSPELHYVVPRTEELAAFIQRIKLGRYLVIFAPRQTGKNDIFPVGPGRTRRRRHHLLSDSAGF